jgi:hypothetical protein
MKAHNESEKFVDPSYLRERIGYCAETGFFWWKSYHGRQKKNVGFGNVNKGGYLRVYVCGTSLMAHRVAFALVNGEWPNGIIDHINGNPRDNRFCNLRVVSYSQNCMNKKKQKNNSSGYTGVYWNSRQKRWHAVIKKDRIRKHIGYFDSKEKAAAARADAESLIFAEFARAEQC